MRRLSLETNSARPRWSGTLWSCRTRPTNEGSAPAACNGVGTSAQATPGATSSTSRARSGVIARSNSALMLSEWPVNTGTRTQVPDTARSGMPRILRLSLRSFCSSSVSPEPSATREPASGTTSKAIGATYLCGSGRLTADPSWVSAAMSWVTAARTWLVSSSTPARPLPDTAWYVLTTTRRSPASACSGASTGMAAMVVQLGLATMPLSIRSRSPGLTSDTMSGTSGSIRQADELSMTTAPAAANTGASTFDVPPPAENRAMSTPVGSAVAASSTTTSAPRHGNVVPAERALAKKRTDPMSIADSSSSRRITPPT